MDDESVDTLPDEELAADLAASDDDDDVFMTSEVSTSGFNVCKQQQHTFTQQTIILPSSNISL